MSFVGKPFKHDVFVSYSHGDADGAGDSKLKQWSQSFIRDLEAELKFDAPTIRMFLDGHRKSDQCLDPTLPVGSTLQQDAASSAVFLVLMSRHYTESTWCALERTWWIEAAKQQNLAYRNRLSFARLTPVPEESWPEDFVDDLGTSPLGRRFYDPSQPNPRPYSWPLVQRGAPPEFTETLLGLAGDIRTQLERVKAELAAREAARQNLLRLTASDGQAVYLYGRETQSEDWRSVRDKLEEERFQVLPVSPDPISPDPREQARLRAERVRAMSGCDAVLLLGNDDGPSLSADLAVVARQDRQLAIQYSARPLPCGIIDTQNMVSRRPEFSRVAGMFGVNWLNASMNELARHIRGWLVEAAA